MPSVDMHEILALDYDFVPETSHFLQLGARGVRGDGHAVHRGRGTALTGAVRGDGSPHAASNTRTLNTSSNASIRSMTPSLGGVSMSIRL